MPNDKLKQFYQAIKSNPNIEGLPDDYSVFETAMSDTNNAKALYDMLKTNPNIEGLPDNTDDFLYGLDLKKKEPTLPSKPSGFAEAISQGFQKSESKSTLKQTDYTVTKPPEVKNYKEAFKDVPIGKTIEAEDYVYKWNGDEWMAFQDVYHTNNGLEYKLIKPNDSIKLTKEAKSFGIDYFKNRLDEPITGTGQTVSPTGLISEQSKPEPSGTGQTVPQKPEEVSFFKTTPKTIIESDITVKPPEKSILDKTIPPNVKQVSSEITTTPSETIIPKLEVQKTTYTDKINQTESKQDKVGLTLDLGKITKATQDATKNWIYENKDKPETLNEIKNYERLYPDDKSILNTKAFVEMNTGDLAGAEETLLKSIDYYKNAKYNTPEVERNLSWAYSMMGRITKQQGFGNSDMYEKNANRSLDRANYLEEERLKDQDARSMVNFTYAIDNAIGRGQQWTVDYLDQLVLGGIKTAGEGIKKLVNTGNIARTEGGLIAAANVLNGSWDVLLGVANYLPASTGGLGTLIGKATKVPKYLKGALNFMAPGMMEFNVGLNIANQTPAREYIPYVMSLPEKILQDQYGIKTEDFNEAQRTGLNLGNLASMMIIFHVAKMYGKEGKEFTSDMAKGYKDLYNNVVNRKDITPQQGKLLEDVVNTTTVEELGLAVDMTQRAGRGDFNKDALDELVSQYPKEKQDEIRANPEEFITGLIEEKRSQITTDMLLAQGKANAGDVLSLGEIELTKQYNEISNGIDYLRKQLDGLKLSEKITKPELKPKEPITEPLKNEGMMGDVVEGRPKTIDEKSILAAKEWENKLFSLKDGTKIKDNDGNIYQVKFDKLYKLTLDNDGNITNSEPIYNDYRANSKGKIYYSTPEFFKDGYEIIPDEAVGEKSGKKSVEKQIDEIVSQPEPPIEEVTPAIKDEKVVNVPPEKPVELKPETVKSTKQKEPTTQKLQTSEAVKEAPVKEIKTDEVRFQNRAELDQTRVNEIADNFNKSKFDPIVVYQDGKNMFVLSGHHRLAAAQKLGLKTIPVRIFEGTEKEAIDYARDSNYMSKSETDTERAKRYREMLSEKKPKEVLDEAKKVHGSDGKYFFNLGHLSENGKALENLKKFENSTDKDSKNKIRSIADWVGELKSRNELSTRQENELFDYLWDVYSNKKGTGKVTNKLQFLDVAEHAIERLKAQDKFTPESVLNLKQVGGKSAMEIEHDSRIESAKENLKRSEKELDDKRKDYISRGANDKQIMEFTQPEQYQVAKAKLELERLVKERSSIKELASQQISLFDQIQEVDYGTAKRISENTEKESAEFEKSVKAIESKAESTDKVKLNEAVEEANKLIKEEDYAVSQPSTEKEVPRPRTAGENITKGGEGVGQGKQGKEVAGKSQEKEIANKFDKLADDLLKFKADDDIIMVGVPFAKEVWNGSLEVVAKTLRVTGDIVQAIKDGIDHIKQTDWYKNLTEENKKHITDKFTEFIKKNVKTEDLSGIKKSLIPKEKIKELDIRKVSNEEFIKIGEELLKSGKVKPEVLIPEINKKEWHTLQPEEEAAFIVYKRELDTKLNEATDRQLEALKSGDAEAELNARAEWNDLERKRQDFETMLVITSQGAGKGFQIRRVLMNKENELEYQINRYKVENGGTIPKDIEEKFRQIDKELKEANKKIAELEKNRAEQEEKQLIDNIKNGIKRTPKNKIKDNIAKEVEYRKKLWSESKGDIFSASAVGLNPKGVELVARMTASYVRQGYWEAAKIVDDIIAEIKAKTGKDVDRKDVERVVAENIDIELEKRSEKSGGIKVPHKLIKELVESGVDNIDDLVSNVKDKLKEVYPEATEREIRDAITSYGKSTGMTKSAITSKINEIKRIGRLISKIEDVEAGILKMKDGVKKDIQSDYEQKLRQILKERLAKIEPTEYEKKKRAEISLKSAKTRLRNQVLEYERRIRENDFSEKKKPQKSIDDELLELQAQRNLAKEKYDYEFEKLKLSQRSWWQKRLGEFVDVINVPRSMMSSADMSAMLRQGLVLSTAHPKLAKESFTAMFNEVFSEKNQQLWLAKVKASPEYPLMKQAGLYLAEPSSKLSAKEEAFTSNLAEKIPYYGAIIRASGRAYIGYLNHLRVSTFLQAIDVFTKHGLTPEADMREFKAIADFINNAAGRGRLGKLEESATILNSTFFSIRLMASRLNLLNPVKYITMPKHTRMMAIKDMASFIGFGLSLVLLANIGDDTENDPRSSDFWKIRIGNTRIDPWGGFQQWAVFLTRFALKEVKSTTSGRIWELNKKMYPNQSRLDLTVSFLQGKLAPVPSVFAKYVLVGESNIGGELDIKQDAINSMIPLWVSDIGSIYKEQGLSKTIGIGALSFFGLGVQYYDQPDSPKRLQRGYKESVGKSYSKTEESNMAGVYELISKQYNPTDARRIYPQTADVNIDYKINENNENYKGTQTVKLPKDLFEKRQQMLQEKNKADIHKYFSSTGNAPSKFLTEYRRKPVETMSKIVNKYNENSSDVTEEFKKKYKKELDKLYLEQTKDKPKSIY